MYNIGSSAKTIDFDESLEPYSKVKLYDKNGKLYEAGTGDGRTLTLTNPFATQQMCNEMLDRVLSATYQPFETTGSIYDPSMDLGDTLEVYGKESRAYSMTETYGSMATANISAPSGEQIDHEIPYQSPMQRGFGRLEEKTEENERKILEAHNELIAALNGEDGAPTDLAAGLQNYVRYDLENDTGFAMSTLFAKIGEQTQAKIEAYADTELGSLIRVQADLVSIAAKRTVIETLRLDVDGATSVNGSLSVHGNIRTSLVNASIEALNGTIIGRTVAASQSLTVRGDSYTPQSITSTSGRTYYVLARS